MNVIVAFPDGRFREVATVPQSNPVDVDITDFLYKTSTSQASSLSTDALFETTQPEETSDETELTADNIVTRGVYADLGLWIHICAKLLDHPPMSISVIDTIGAKKSKTFFTELAGGETDISVLKTSKTHPWAKPVSDTLYVVLREDWGAELDELETYFWHDDLREIDLELSLNLIDKLRFMFDSDVPQLTGSIAVQFDNYREYCDQPLDPFRLFMYSDIESPIVSSSLYSPTTNERRILGVSPNTSLITKGTPLPIKSPVGTCIIDTIEGRVKYNTEGNLSVTLSESFKGNVSKYVKNTADLVSSISMDSLSLDIKNYPLSLLSLVGETVVLSQLKYAEIRRRVSSLLKNRIMINFEQLELSARGQITVNGITPIGEIAIYHSTTHDAPPNVSVSFSIRSEGIFEHSRSNTNPVEIAYILGTVLGIIVGREMSANVLLNELLSSDPNLLAPQEHEGVKRPFCRFCQKPARRPRVVPVTSVTAKDIKEQSAFIINNQTFPGTKLALKCGEEYPHLAFYAFPNGHCYPCCAKRPSTSYGARMATQGYCLSKLGARKEVVDGIIDQIDDESMVIGDSSYNSSRFSPGTAMQLPHILRGLFSKDTNPIMVFPIYSVGLTAPKLFNKVYDTETVRNYVIFNIFELGGIISASMEASESASIALRSGEQVGLIVRTREHFSVIVNSDLLPVRHMIRDVGTWAPEATLLKVKNSDLILGKAHLRTRIQSHTDFFDPSIMAATGIRKFYTRDGSIVAAEVGKVLVHTVHRQEGALAIEAELSPFSSIKKPNYPSLTQLNNIIRKFSEVYNLPMENFYTHALVSVRAITPALITKLENRDPSLKVTHVNVSENGPVIRIRPENIALFSDIPVFFTVETTGEGQDELLHEISMDSLELIVERSMASLKMWVRSNLADYIVSKYDIGSSVLGSDENRERLVQGFIKHCLKTKMYTKSKDVKIEVTADGVVLTHRACKSPVELFETSVRVEVFALPNSLRAAIMILKSEYPVISVVNFVNTLNVVI